MVAQIEYLSKWLSWPIRCLWLHGRLHHILPIQYLHLFGSCFQLIRASKLSKIVICVYGNTRLLHIINLSSIYHRWWAFTARNAARAGRRTVAQDTSDMALIQIIFDQTMLDIFFKSLDCLNSRNFLHKI